MDRQRYMAELSKLLTFMFKEDRAEILQYYNDLLDNAEDEQALLDEFGSPTKLAVTISRTYSREERKLSVNIDSKTDSNSEANPAEYTKPDENQFRPITPVPIIPANEDDAEDEPERDSDEVSYADEIEGIRREMAEEGGREYTPIFFENPEPEPEEKAVASEDKESEAEEEIAESSEGEDQAEKSSEEAPAEEDTPVEEEVPAEEDTPADEEEPEDEPEPEKPEKESPVYPVYDNLPVDEDEEDAASATKLSVGLLILYLIFAIPIGLALSVAVLAVALVIIICAATILVIGVQLISFAFGLAVFADIMLVVGAALIILGIGILLLWAGIWLAIAVIKALYKGIVKLGRRICTKEAEL